MSSGRRRLFRACLLGCGAALSAWLPDLPAAQANGPSTFPAVACSPDTPIASPRDTVRVTAWAIPPPGRSVHYAWVASAGRLEGEGREVRWHLQGTTPGLHSARVRITDPEGASADCAVHLIVRGPARRGLSRETGWSFLEAGQSEAEGYGLYSYLLLGSPPSPAQRDRYRQAIEAYLGLIPEIRRLEQYVRSRRDLNIVYLPIASPPGSTVSAAWCLDHYDYARARILLRAIPDSHREGPYFVSSLTPLGGATEPPAEYLLQDLSSVPPHLVASWVKEFLNQAAQERFWEGRTVERLALNLRTTIGALALGLPDVRKGLESWIAWTQ